MSELNCSCGDAARKFTVNKPGPNQGREFFTCHYNPARCTSWAFADEVAKKIHAPTGAIKGVPKDQSQKYGGDQMSAVEKLEGRMSEVEGTLVRMQAYLNAKLGGRT